MNYVLQGVLICALFFTFGCSEVPNHLVDSDKQEDELGESQHPEIERTKLAQPAIVFPPVSHYHGASSTGIKP